MPHTFAESQEVRHDIRQARELAEAAGLTEQELVIAFLAQVAREVQNLQGALGRGGGGRRAVSPAGAPGTLKQFAFNSQAEADTDIFNNDIEFNQDVAVLRTTFALTSTATNRVLSLVLSSGSNEEVLDFLQGTALTAGALYSFDVPVSSDVTANYRINGDDTVAVLVAQEIDVAGP